MITVQWTYTGLINSENQFPITQITGCPPYDNRRRVNSNTSIYVSQRSTQKQTAIN